MNKLLLRGIALCIFLLTVSILTVYWTVDFNSLSYLQSFNPLSLVLVSLCLVAGMFFDGLRLQRLVRVAGYHLPVKAMLQVIAGNYFMAMLTPGASGGAVAQVILLKSMGVPVAVGTPIVLIRTIFSIVFLIFSLPFIFMADHFEIPYIGKEFLLFLSLLAVLGLAGSIYGMNRRAVKSFILKFLPGKTFFQKRKYIKRLQTMNRGFSILYREPRECLLVFFESGASLIFLYSIAPALMLAFTDSLSFWAIINRMILLNLILYFAPTPGGAGIAEALFVFFFSSFLPAGTVGIVAVGWRIFAEYVPFFFGMYGMFTFYGKKYLQ